MGQYYYAMNLDKRQFLHPHKFDEGLKLLEFGMSSGGTMTGLALLLAVGNGRGGGDWRGNDPQSLIGSWAGDRIAIVGEYVHEGEVGFTERREAGDSWHDISHDVMALVRQA